MQEAALWTAIEHPTVEITWIHGFLCSNETTHTYVESFRSIIKKHGLEGNFWINLEDSTLLHDNGSIIRFHWGEHQNILYVEEGQLIRDDSWNSIIERQKNEGFQLWSSVNPHKKSDPIWKNIIQSPDSLSYVRKVNFDMNPFFPINLDEERKRMLSLYGTAYNNVWLGEPETEEQPKEWPGIITGVIRSNEV